MIQLFATAKCPKMDMLLQQIAESYLLAQQLNTSQVHHPLATYDTKSAASCIANGLDSSPTISPTCDDETQCIDGSVVVVGISSVSP